MKWLMRHKIPLFILDYNGSILSSTLPKEPVVGNLRKAQIEAYQDTEIILFIDTKIIHLDSYVIAKMGKFINLLV